MRNVGLLLGVVIGVMFIVVVTVGILWAGAITRNPPDGDDDL